MIKKKRANMKTNEKKSIEFVISTYTNVYID